MHSFSQRENVASNLAGRMRWLLHIGLKTKVPSYLKPDFQGINDNWVVCELGNRNGETGSDQSRERR